MLRRPVNSITAAKILSAGEAINEDKDLCLAFSELLPIQIDIFIAVDSRDLVNSLSVCCDSINHSIWVCVNEICYEFESQNINRMLRIP